MASSGYTSTIEPSGPWEPVRDAREVIFIDATTTVRPGDVVTAPARCRAQES